MSGQAQVSDNKEGVVKAVLGVNPFLKSTTVYGVLVLFLVAVVYLLWTHMGNQEQYMRQQDEKFMNYVEKRDREMIELMTRINVRLEDQERMQQSMETLHVKIDKLLDKK